VTNLTTVPGASSSRPAPRFPGFRGIRLYALASFAIIAVAAGAFTLAYDDGAARQVVLVSAVLAFVVQLVAFAVARLLAASGHGIAGWGLGAVFCFVALVVYGFVCRAAGLPTSAGMISLATFFFLTEVIEPPFLNI
jgi:hypothetical protein